jgi:hypothetical protein
MKVPAVAIHREPLLAMLHASVEMYNRECLGLMYGYCPSKGRDCFVITNAIQLAAVFHSYCRVRHSIRADKRVRKFKAAAPKVFQYLADFSLSDQDLLNIDPSDRFSLLIAIIRRGKRRLKWCLKSRKTRLRGSLGDFDFHILSYWPIRNGGGKLVADDRGIPRVERMPIRVARGTLALLNRATKKA